ncbi:MAG: thiamine-phosphate kinase [Acidobacteriota bacterium]
MTARRVDVLDGEDALLDRLRSSAPAIGDDAAFLHAHGDLAVTVDTQIEGIHFDPARPPEHVARRLLAVNLSDLAAVGAEPAWAFLSLSAPTDYPRERFLDAFTLACRDWDLELAGGDLSAAPTVVAVATLLGRPAGRRWLRRDAALAGHRLWIGGPLGDSALGLELLRAGARLDPEPMLPWLETSPEVVDAAAGVLRRHLEPSPQLELGRWLTNTREGAAMDVSDGLARDLHRLCRASDVAAIIEAEALPRPSEELVSRIGRDPLDLALTGGEDYVLLFTLPESDAPPLHLGCRAIGRIVPATAAPRVLLTHDGRQRALPAIGFDHLSAER